jgi:hypothetical protein
MINNGIILDLVKGDAVVVKFLESIEDWGIRYVGKVHKNTVICVIFAKAVATHGHSASKTRISQTQIFEVMEKRLLGVFSKMHSSYTNTTDFSPSRTSLNKLVGSRLAEGAASQGPVPPPPRAGRTGVRPVQPHRALNFLSGTWSRQPRGNGEPRKSRGSRLGLRGRVLYTNPLPGIFAPWTGLLEAFCSRSMRKGYWRRWIELDVWA